MRFLALLLAVAVLSGCGGDSGVDPAKARAELDSQGIDYTEDAFVEAAEDGDLDVVKLFVEAGMSVDTATDDGGGTALHWAAWSGSLKLVRYLVSQGADVNATDDGGGTALHWAALSDSGSLELVRYLVEEHGLDVNATDGQGWTALLLAAARGHLEVVQYLVEAGADVTATDGDGDTARDKAARRGHTEVAEYLKSKGG